MKKRIIGVLLLSVFLLIGCTNKDEEEQNGNSKVYYLNKEETALESEAVDLKGDTKEAQVNEMLSILEKNYDQSSFKKLVEPVIPTSFSFGEAGQLILNFSVDYYNITGLTEILYRAAFVKSFCSIEGIVDIEFYVNDQPLLLTGEIPVGMMSAEDFVDASGSETYSQTVNLTVYFANKEGTALKEYHRNVLYDGTLSGEQLVIKLLIQGPGKEDTDMMATLPEGTEILKVNVKDGVCYVDFNEKFLEKPTEVTEEVVLYSVVNSLIELGYISKVQFLVNGVVPKAYQTVDLSVLYERNLSIIETEN